MQRTLVAVVVGGFALIGVVVVVVFAGIGVFLAFPSLDTDVSPNESSRSGADAVVVVETATPSVTSTPEPSPTPEPTPTPTATPSPTATPRPLARYGTQDTRWLQRTYPTLYRQMEELDWVKDGLSEVEHEVIDQLLYVGRSNIASVRIVLGMPFLESVEPDDVILIAAAGTMRDAEEIRKLSIPGYAYIKTESGGTELSPSLKISVVRFGTPGQSWTFDYARDAVEFSERIMQLPLPVDHVILVMNEAAVTENYAGTNYGFAISGLPGFEEGWRKYDKYRFSSLILHEVAHYFWRSGADWIDEGVADTFEYIYGIENGISPGLLAPYRGLCEMHNLQMLNRATPDQQESQFLCNYFLGQSLFVDLLDDLGVDEFSRGLRDLYRLSLFNRSDEGIETVREAFPNSADIVRMHWSGKMNAPENRPFDEGVEWRSHDLIQWTQYPTYDGDSVTFRGTLLGDAVLSNETFKAAQSGQWQNFRLQRVGTGAYIGTILPQRDGDRDWLLDDIGDTIAQEYQLDKGSFSVTFSFAFGHQFGDASDYFISVWGFHDETRKPFTQQATDLLGYARIRVRE